jgi:Ca2+-binding RTX toxin-like protein
LNAAIKRYNEILAKFSEETTFTDLSTAYLLGGKDGFNSANQVFDALGIENMSDGSLSLGVFGYTNSTGGLVPLSPSAIESHARTDIAYSYALVNLNPFVVLGADYSSFNQNGELDLYDPATGNGLTNMYLADRAEMLANLIYGNINDTTSTGTDVQYVDLPSNLTLNKPLLLAPERTIIFGGENGEVLEGTKHWASGDNYNDRLYGGGGKDVLLGYGGDDYLEGGTGGDVLDGGSGNDILHGGSGRDIYMFGPGHGADTIIEVRETDGFKHGVINYLNNGEIRIAYGTFTRDDNDPDTWHSSQGFTLTNGATWTLTTPGGTIDLGEDFISGDFGIKLVESSAEIPEPGETTNDIFGDPAIHSATIAPGEAGQDWKIVKTYNHEYEEDNDGNQVLVRYDVDYYLIDENGNPTEGGGEARDDIRDLHDTADNDHFMSGGGDDDILLDKGGDDLVETGDGNDKVRINSSGNHVIDMGDGDDELITATANPGNLTVYGGNGRDYLGGGAGADIIVGGEGADGLYGSGGDDLLYGDAEGEAGDFITQGATEEGTGLQGEWVDAEDGDDQIFTGAGNDLIAGGDGNDLIVSGGGNDYIWGDWNTGSSSGDAWRNWAVTETVTGDEENNTYTYTVANIHGQDNLGVGDDIIYAGAGNDVVFGERGDDLIFLEAGDDKAWGGAGADILSGGDGDDLINGDNGLEKLAESLHGDDYLDGGDGNDTLIGSGDDDILFGGDGDDVLDGDEGGLAASLHGDDYLDGGAGNDILIGNGGSDMLLGGDGDDEIYGEASDTPSEAHGDDYLDGGAGNDTLIGTGGDDILFGGGGDDVLDGDTSGLAHSLFGNDYLDGGAGNDILIGNGGSDVLLGGDGNDKLYGEASDTPDSVHGNDILDGGKGTDALIGGGGNDTYIFRPGDGQLLDGVAESITDNEGENRVRFEDGIIRGGVQVFRSGDDMVIGYGSGDWLYIFEGMKGAVQTFTFSDGETLDWLQLVGKNSFSGVKITTSEPRALLVGGASGDELTATGGYSTFSGGLGNDLLIGGGGNNTYLYNFGDGTDHIMDSGGQVDGQGNPMPNRILFGPGITPADITLSLGSLVIKVGAEPGNAIHIENFDPDDVFGQRSIDLFEFHDGSVLTYEQLLALGFDIEGTQGNDDMSGTNVNDRLYGGAGDDILFGGDGNDVLVGGPGNDFLGGGPGNDVYRFGRGYGEDTISHKYFDYVAGKRDVIELSPDITPADLSVARDGDDLVLFINGTSDRLILKSYLLDHPDSIRYQVEEIRFAQGVVWDVAMVKEMISEEVNTPPHVSGPVVLGDMGEDGSLIITAAQLLANAHDVDSDTLSIVNLEAGSGTLTDNGNGNWTYTPVADFNGAVEFTYEVSDGTVSVPTSAGLEVFPVNDAPVVSGPVSLGNMSADEALLITVEQLFSHANDVDGDVLSIYNLTASSGTLIDNGNGTWNYQAAPDYAGPVSFSYQVTDGIEEVTASAGLTVEAMLNIIQGNNNHNLLLGTNGDDLIRGAGGDDTLLGQDGNDTLVGGPGNDLLVGGRGDDTYVFSLGDGRDTIFDSDLSFLWNWGQQESGEDTIRFGEGIGLEDVALFMRYGSFEIQYGEQDLVTVLNQNHSSGRIERIELADGSYLTDADVNQLIQQMATFAVDEGIAMNSLDDVRNNQDLMTLVANAWHSA